MGDGNDGECGVGASDCSDWSMGTKKLLSKNGETKRSGMKDKGLEKAVQSLAQPVERMLTVYVKGGKDENERRAQHGKVADYLHIESLVNLGRQ